MKNPYNYKGSSLETPASRVLAVTPDDHANLERTAKALRVWNESETAATIAIETIGGDTVTLTVPPATLLVEPIIVAKVLETGTTSGLEIFAYTD